MKMSDDDLLSFLATESTSAYQYNSGQLAAERERSLRDYMRMPYGNEQEGSSQVVASDVFDAVEGILPDLVEVFISTDEAVRFDPVGPEDEEGATQATDACNYVFYKQNNGFMLLYTAAKDALMMKTGGVKWFWDERRTPNFTTYKAVDEMSLALFLTTNPKAEVVEKEEVEPEQNPDPNVLPPQGKVFTVKIKTVETKGRVRVVAIPPDELRISKRHNSILLDDCPYVAHVSRKTLSELKQMGFDSVTADDVRAARDDGELAQDAELRQTINDGQLAWQSNRNDNEIDESAIEGWCREEYVLVDYDGDGIAERRRVIRLGDKILDNKECSHVQIAAWTPYILTHRFDGISVSDLVSDFQRIATDIWRQSLDNLYLANNQETVVLTDSQGNPQANIDDLLNRRPGGVIREKVAGAVRPFVERWQGIEAVPMIEMLASAKENRTGYTRYSAGLDANSLNKTATGISIITNNTQKRMKLMARIMAEALVAPMFRGIFKTLTDYCMDKVSFRLSGKFVQYDPQEWRDGYDMSINVGIGAGDKIQQQTMLQGIEMAQMAAVQGGGMGTLITPRNLYNLQKRKVELAGFKDAAEFWTEPPEQMPPPQPPPPDPKVQIEGAKLQQDGQKFQAQQSADAQKFTAEKQFEAWQAELQRQHEAQMEQMRLGFQAQSKQLENAPAEAKEQEENQTMQMVAQSLQMLAQAMLAPKQIIKDEQGRPVGVAPVIQ